MRTITGLVALSALAAAHVAAAQPATIKPAPADAVAHVRSTVEFLADDLLEGRDTGSRGHEIAAAYVASEFRALGLEPAGENGSYYQWVPLRRTSLVPGTTRVTLTGADGKPAALSAGEIYVQPSYNEAVRDIDAGLVFVGYGIDDKALGMDDYAGLDVRGKIVVYLRGAPSGLTSDIAAHVGSTKLDAAVRHGAIGAIALGAKAPRDPKAMIPAALAEMDSTDWIHPDGRASQDPKGFRVSLSVNPMTGLRLFDGAAMSLDAVRAAAAPAGARPKGFPLKARLSIHSESKWTDFKSPEVIARLPGSDPKLKAEHIAVMGHLDHIGVDTKAAPGKDRIYNGALDNAAGVATVLEAARQFRASGKAPKRSVLFVANTGEEKGLLGASYFADHPTVPKGSIVGGVDLDMPLVLYPFTDVVAFGGDHSTIAPAIAEAGKAMGIKVSPDFMPEEAIFVRSDHYELVKRGIPAILLATGTANGGGEQWGKFMGGAYHKVGDDLTQKIDWDALARYAELNYRITRQLADAPVRPMWYEGNYFGNLFDPNGARAKRP